MTTDTLTRPRRALGESTASPLAAAESAAVERPLARPRRRRRDPLRALRSTSPGRRPAEPYLLLVGPSGSPIWQRSA